MIPYAQQKSEDQIHSGANLCIAYSILSILCLLMPWNTPSLESEELTSTNFNLECLLTMHNRHPDVMP